MKKKIKIELLNGLHARPATQITVAASKCLEDVLITARGQTINAKSVTSVLTLGLPSGEELEVESDNEGIFEEIKKILSSQEREQANVEIIKKKPHNLKKFIEKRIKKTKKKVFFSTKTFSDAIRQSVDRGQIIDSSKIFEVGKIWCIDGTVPELIHALGVCKDNPLEIFTGM